MSGFIEGEDRHQATLFPERLDDHQLLHLIPMAATQGGARLPMGLMPGIAAAALVVRAKVNAWIGGAKRGMIWG
jgi:hypothetical protein